MDERAKGIITLMAALYTLSAFIWVIFFFSLPLILVMPKPPGGGSFYILPLLLFLSYPIVLAYCMVTSWKLASTDPKKSVRRVLIPAAEVGVWLICMYILFLLDGSA